MKSLILKIVLLGVVLLFAGLIIYNSLPDYTGRGRIIIIGNDQPAIVLYDQRDIFGRGRKHAMILYRDAQNVWHEKLLPTELIHEIPSEFKLNSNGTDDRSKKGQDKEIKESN